MGLAPGAEEDYRVAYRRFLAESDPAESPEGLHPAGEKRLLGTDTSEPRDLRRRQVRLITTRPLRVRIPTDEAPSPDLSHEDMERRDNADQSPRTEDPEHEGLNPPWLESTIPRNIKTSGGLTTTN